MSLLLFAILKIVNKSLKIPDFVINVEYSQFLKISFTKRD